MLLEVWLTSVAALVIIGVLLSPIAARAGAPLLLLFLALGMLVGEDGPGGVRFDDFAFVYEVGGVALAIILFAGGVETEFRDLRKAWAPALTLATLGVCLTAAIVGLVGMALLGMPPAQALLIGAVVGSTDAAATFMLLQQRAVAIGGRAKETILIESGLNDPVAIFLTILLVGFVDFGSDSLGWHSLLTLAQQFGIGAALGVAGGAGVAWLVNHVPLQNGLRSVLVFGGGLLIFGFAGLLGGSGFLAVYLAGILVRARMREAIGSVEHFHQAMAWLSQITLFLLLGLLVTPRELLSAAPTALVIAVVLIFIARPVAVLVSLAPFRFSMPERLFVGWVGLRGAVPIFLAIIPVISPGPVTVQFFNEVFIIVIASLVLQGWTIGLAGRLTGVAPRA